MNKLRPRKVAGENCRFDFDNCYGDAMLLGQRRDNWRVIYNDGKKSEWMNKKTAEGYMKIFGGTIERRKRIDDEHEYQRRKN